MKVRIQWEKRRKSRDVAAEAVGEREALTEVLSDPAHFEGIPADAEMVLTAGGSSMSVDRDEIADAAYGVGQEHHPEPKRSSGRGAFEPVLDPAHRAAIKALGEYIAGKIVRQVVVDALRKLGYADDQIDNTIMEGLNIASVDPTKHLGELGCQHRNTRLNDAGTLQECMDCGATMKKGCSWKPPLGRKPAHLCNHPDVKHISPGPLEVECLDCGSIKTSGRWVLNGPTSDQPCPLRTSGSHVWTDRGYRNADGDPLDSCDCGAGRVSLGNFSYPGVPVDTGAAREQWGFPSATPEEQAYRDSLRGMRDKLDRSLGVPADLLGISKEPIVEIENWSINIADGQHPQDMTQVETVDCLLDGMVGLEAGDIMQVNGETFEVQTVEPPAEPHAHPTARQVRMNRAPGRALGRSNP